MGGSVHEKGLAVYEQNAARRAERLAAPRGRRPKRRSTMGDDDPDELDEDFEDEEPEGRPHIQPPGWLAGVFTGVIR